MAGYPTAAGVPSLTATYIPEIWASKLLVKFYANTVLSEIANTDYEGEIKQRGDTVHISNLPDMVIKDYTVGMDLETDKPAPTTVDLLIDKGKYFQFASNPVNDKQSIIPYINKWSEDASKQMKISIETACYADIYASANSYNKGTTAGKISANINLGVSGTPFGVTKDNVITKILDMETVLDEQNVPEDGRYILFPAWVCALLKDSDLKNASLTGDQVSLLRKKGGIGMVSSFQIFKTNLLTTATDGSDKVTNCIFGQTSALTFATQLVENEIIPNPKDFGKLHRGLQVYGYKVVKSEALGHFYIKRG